MDFRNKHPGNPLSSFYQSTTSTTPPNFTPPHLNPSTPSFQPTGMEMLQMQQYQQLPPTPPSKNRTTADDLMHMRKYVLSCHFTHTKDMIGLQRVFEREAQSNFNEIEGIKAAVKRDLQTLQAQIEVLRAQVGTEHHDSNATTRQTHDRYDMSFHSQQGAGFTESGLTEIYLEEANTLEATAANLRKQATKLRGGENVAQSNTMKLLEGAKDLADMSRIKTEFACCGIKYRSFKDLLGHVHAIHSSDQQHISKLEREDTPTYVPARHPKPATESEIRAEPTIKPEPATKPEDQSTTKTTTKSPSSEDTWMPLAVRQMPSAPTLEIEKNTETFTWELINNTFQGKQWSPGFYFISEQAPIKSYWVLETEYEPCLPKAPGHHGAKLTAFFNDTESSARDAAPDEINFHDVPVFIRLPGQQDYVYYGNYSQKRFSDRVDYDNLLCNIPENVRKYWAQQLSELGRPDWVTGKLIHHLWPMPGYYGPIPTDSAVATPVTEATAQSGSSQVLEKRVERALYQFAFDLKEWKKETDMKVKHLKAENLLQAFEKADADEEPGLRLWWEYLQFERYDQKCYDFLVDKKKPRKTPTRSITAQKTTAGMRTDTTVQVSSDAERIIPTSPTKLKRSPQASKAPNWTTSVGKAHEATIKPWEQATPTNKTGDTKPSGDLQAAKDFQAGVEKHFAPGFGRSKDGKKPPHLRYPK